MTRFRSVGIQVAGEYADLAFASVGQSGHRTTWNVAAEVGFRSARTDVFARVRHYDYDLQRSREGEAGPKWPGAVSRCSVSRRRARLSLKS